VDQIFPAVRDDVQCRRINRVFITALGLETFGPEDVVDFLLDA
jgi:hypothetical protein